MRSAPRSKEHRHTVDPLAERRERLGVEAHASALVAWAVEGGHDGLRHGRQLARREGHEGHARAIGVARAARTVAITVEGRAVGAFEAVVLADDPLFHVTGSPLGTRRVCRFPYEPTVQTPRCEGV